MAIPAVEIIWDDQSRINSVTQITEDNIDRPIIMTVITADKGPEEWKHKVFGKDFYDYYGTDLSFTRHGQALIQAANVIDAGGYLTVRRIMPEDARLANVCIYVELTYTNIPYSPPHGSPGYGMWLWEDITGTSTPVTMYSTVNPATGTTADSAPTDVPCWQKVMTNEVTLDFKAVSFGTPPLPAGSTGSPITSSALTTNDPAEVANWLYTNYRTGGPVGSNNQIYPLFVITDNGRGVSKKRFRISRDTTASTPVPYVRYFLEVMEDDQTLETIAFTMDPSVIEKDVNMSIHNAIKLNSKQLRCVFFEDEYKAMCDNVASLLNWTNGSPGSTTPTFEDPTDFYRADTLFGTDFYAVAIPNLIVNTDLNNIYGYELENGDNGWMLSGTSVKTDNPLESYQYPILLRDAFAGQPDQHTEFIVPADDIYDFDNNRIDAVFDANYPELAKRAIEELAAFREDFVFFRDMGIGLKNVDTIKTANTNSLKNRYCATYVNSYDIYDPYTRKQISVTVMYDLARLFVGHFINGRSRPFCGIKYGIIIPLDNMVKGTLNFSPKRTPSIDQRQVFDDLRINYLSFYDGSILAMNSEYTSQTEYTQLSWINNVLAVQQVIKAIRVLCPKIRYSFLDGEDLQRYKQDVNELIIDKYSSLFKSFTIEYVENSQYDSNKIIYAILRVQFRNFIQSEIFKIIALQS